MVVKRRDLLRLLRDEARRQGVELLVREGGNHTRVAIGDRRSVVPRHAEINEITAKAVLKQMGVRR